MSKNVFIVAGDPSGDLHGANLVRKLKEKDPSIDIACLGGKELSDAGANLVMNLVDDAVVGFTEVLAHLPSIIQAYQAALSVAKRSDLVILIDYPGFNLRLAKSIVKMKNPPKILYYIAPQVWAWHQSRAKLMSEIIDKIAVVFPFETDWFSNSEFVGHPLMDLETPEPDEEFKNSRVASLLPGSRRKEISRHVGVLSQCATRLKKLGYRPVMSIADPKLIEQFRDIDCELYSGDARRLLASSEIAIVKSGTSTMQAALIGIPFVTIYRLSWLSYTLGKLLVKLQHIAMPNILLQRDLIPELIQSDATPDKIIDALTNLDHDELKSEFRRLRTILGEDGSAERTADICIEMLPN